MKKILLVEDDPNLGLLLQDYLQLKGKFDVVLCKDGDEGLRAITIGDAHQKLSTKEAELLRLLCLHKNEVLTREEALLNIWHDDNYFNGRSMDVFLSKIRKYLKDDSNV